MSKILMKSGRHNKLPDAIEAVKKPSLPTKKLQMNIPENIHKEYTVDDMVKTDFFVENYGCIEVKSLLSGMNKIIFPDNSSNRLERQLLQYIELLNKRMNITFVFIAMSANLLDFEWNDKKENIKLYFKKAFLLGLRIKAFSVIYEDNEFRITENKVLEQNIIKTISI